MRLFFTALGVLFLSSCHDNKQDAKGTVKPENKIESVSNLSEDILPFPEDSYDYSNRHKTNIKVSCDTTIELNTLDNKMSGSLRFNWEYDESYYEADYHSDDEKQTGFYKIKGVQSFDILTSDARIYHHNLDSIISLEAYREWNDSTSYLYNKPYKSITFQDVNFDGYLDMLMQRGCGGKRCFKAYFLFNEEYHDFVFHKNLNWLIPYAVDIENEIIYSRDGGVSNITYQSAYRWDGSKFDRVQARKMNYTDSTVSIEYFNANNSLLLKCIEFYP